MEPMTDCSASRLLGMVRLINASSMCLLLRFLLRAHVHTHNRRYLGMQLYLYLNRPQRTDRFLHNYLFLVQIHVVLFLDRGADLLGGDGTEGPAALSRA